MFSHNVELSGFSVTDGFITSGLDQGGAVLNAGTLTVRNSTFTRNRSEQYGGAFGNTNTGNLTLIECSLANNTAASDSGALNNRGTLNLISCTVAANASGGSGGAIYTNNTLNLTDTIVANNTATGSGPDIFRPSGTVTPFGVNLLSNLSGSSLLAGSTVIGADPKLSPLG